MGAFGVNPIGSSRVTGVEPDVRERLKAAASLPELLGLLDPEIARALVASALASKSVAPFELKGGRQGRLLAERIVEREGVPESFGRVLRQLQEWIEGGCGRGFEIVMSGA